MKPTFDSILDTAEQLFALNGIQATSVRDLTRKAGVNLAAVHYHFQSKDGLVRAVLARRAGDINRRRLEALDEIERKAGARRPNLRAILTAFIAPTVRFFEEQRDYLRFAGRMWSEPGPELREILKETFGPVAARYLAALAKAVPDVPKTELHWRFHCAVGAMLHLWIHADELSEWMGAKTPRARLVEYWVDFCAAGIAARSGEQQ